tara:strand:+ start:153 stop:392 length:240 start_codon:yes stop_codon:yes gene_type:complete
MIKGENAMRVNKCRVCGSKLATRNHTARKHSATNLCFDCMRNPPLGERCLATTSRNEKCKIRKYRDTDYCKVHQYLREK